MPRQRGPSISAVVAAYQAEDFIAEALESILGQSRPPDEVIVVDDGSTDGTAGELEPFAGRIRVIWQPNRGCPGAFNTAFRAARGDFVAMCGADDVWEPRKLEWQAEAAWSHPEADVFCGHALMVGRIEREHPPPPGIGLLDSAALKDALFEACYVCAPSVLIRRSLFERLGPFIENFGADDYEYWFRCLRNGARFYFDPRPLVRWRQHENNLTRRTEWMNRCAAEVRLMYQADVSDRAIADDLFKTARQLARQGQAREARRTFWRSLRLGRRSSARGNARALVWIAILSMPAAARGRVARTLTRLSRTIDGLRGGRDPALP